MEDQPTTAPEQPAEPQAPATYVVPLADRILVRRFKEEERTPGGLIIPDQAKEKPAKGEVVAVGPGRRLENGTRSAIDIPVGAVVLFGKYSGSDLKLDDEDLLLLREDEVIAEVKTKTPYPGTVVYYDGPVPLPAGR